MISIKQQKGVNLIELMIVGFLMVLIGFFMIKIMTSSNESASRSDGIAQAQETARLIISWLYNDIRRAGYSTNLQEPRIQPFSDICTAASGTPPANNGNCSFESIDPSVNNDRVAIRRIYSAAIIDRGDHLDCTGVDLRGTAGLELDASVLVDVYWVERDNGNDGDDYDDVLRCVTYNEDTGFALNPAQTIASGVEGLQVLYAETNGGSGTVTTYVPGDQITSMDDVHAVRISILTRAFSDFALTTATRSYILLDADDYTFTDRVPRQIQTTTISLNNYDGSI